MPRLKKKEDASPPPEAPAVTLTAGRSRRTIKPNRKYLNDSVVLATASKSSSRSSSADSDASEDDYRQDQDDDDDEVLVPKSAAGRKSLAGAAAAAAAAKKAVSTPEGRGRGRPLKPGNSGTRTEPVKNLRKEVLKKMDLSTLNMGKARVVLTPINKQILKRKLDLDESMEKAKPPAKSKEPDNLKEKEPEKVKPKPPVKPKEPEKPVKPNTPPIKAAKPNTPPLKATKPSTPPARAPKDEKEKPKPEIRVFRKRQPEEPAPKEQPPILRKVINPVAVKKQLVEKSILDKRAKKVEDSTPSSDDDDDDDDVQIVGITRETTPYLGRKVLRKSPLVAKQISPLSKKIVKPVPGKTVEVKPIQMKPVQVSGMPPKNMQARPLPPRPMQVKPMQAKPVPAKIVPPKPAPAKPVPVRSFPPKATPPSLERGLKRKPGDSDEDEEEEEETRTSKFFKKRATKIAKLSLSMDSDDESEDSDVSFESEESEEDDEPIRRTTRSSLTSGKGSANSTPQNSSAPSAAKARESPASAGAKLPKDVEAIKSNLTKSISMPALDKTKANARFPGLKPVQTPVAKALGLSKPMAQSTPKLTQPSPVDSVGLADKKSKSEVNLVDPILSPEKGPKETDQNKTKKSATIRIVDIGDIMKKKSASTPDVRKTGLNKKSLQDEYSSDSSDDSFDDHFDSPQKASSSEKPKTNNQLVATILERKRPINLDHLRANRPVKRGRPTTTAARQPPVEKPTLKAIRQPVINLTEDEVDFEDMLQTNIVTANKVQKVMNPNVMRGRRRPSGTNENEAKNSSSPGTRTVSLPKSPAISGAKTLTSSNNNNVYKSNNNGRFGSTSSLNRSGSSSPQKNPPRILNSTMKLGDSRPFAKLVANSGNKHYSIDLTDPDNNVKLIASPDSPPHSPIKRSPAKVVPRPIVSSAGLRNASNALNKPVGGAVQRSISSLTTSSGSSPKMKKITCYETWYVINIPNNENKPDRPSFAMSMIGLGNEAAKIQLPSNEWSHKIILTKRKLPPNEDEEVFNGEVEDRAINEDEKRNYEPCNIMFRRRTATPGKFNLQYDRAVIFKNDTFFINVDGKNCQLVGAPSKLYGCDDIETLLSVVDFVNLKNACVELSAA